MTATLHLEQMLLQLQRAYLAASQLIDEQEARRLRSYFQEDGTPYVQTICVPDLQSTEAWQKVEVPLYTLIPATSLQMQEMIVEFECKLEELTGFEITSPVISKAPEKMPRSRQRKTRNETARVRITLKSASSNINSGESSASAHGSKMEVDVTIVYPGKTLRSYSISD